MTLVMLSHSVLEKQMNSAIASIAALEGVQGEVTRIRVEHLN